MLGVLARDRATRRSTTRSSRSSRRRSRRSPSASPTKHGVYMGPVINAQARDNDPRATSRRARRRAGWSSAAAPVAGKDGYLHPADRHRRRRAERRRSRRRRSSARCWRSSRRRPTTTRSRSPTTPSTASPAPCTRSDPDKIERARREFHVGNLYINRKCTGAIVGAHPFGGFNMSGTDSKAGGRDYLLLFLQAKSIAEKLG